MLFYVVTPEAVRALRQSLGESQQAFSNRLGLALGSVAHYETGRRSPDLVVTLSLFNLASEVGRKDLADFFLQTINTGRAARVMVPVPSEEERSKIRALQLILHDARFSHLRAPLLKLLAPVEVHLKEAAALERIETADIPAVARQMIEEQQQHPEQKMMDAFKVDPFKKGKK
jgi:transcriptional regulator with XRE-family HTH domain